MNSGTLAKLFFIALVFLLLFASPAQAATFTANSQATLNSAIQSANAALDEDTINITGDITLSGDLLTIFGVTIINGNGWTINGGGEHTAITLGGSHGNVTINNLTLAQNKGATSYHGGAIYYPSGVSLTLDNVTIRDSTTAASDANGGGLYCSAANLTIRNSRIHGNSAHEGGGLYLASGCTNAQIIKSRIYDNDSAGGTVSLGGGLTRAKSGGGIHVAGGASVTISGSRIYDNEAGTGDAGANGGGIGVYASSGSAAIVNINSSSIYNNLAYGSGGGLYMNGRTTLNVSGSAFYGNEAKASGGVGGGLTLKNEPGSAATHTITNTSIINNRAAGHGGGLSASMNFQGTTSVVTLRHVTISGNSTSLTGTHQGAGLYATQVKVTLQNSIIFGNTAVGSASNCIFSGLPTASQSGALTPILAHNIIGPGSASSTANQAHCTPNSDSSDPQLESSATGNPPYFNLRVGSPAIDSADCLSSVTTDQRGRTRPNPASSGGKCDKGAIEWYAPPPPPPPSADTGGSGGGGGGGSDDDETLKAVLAKPVSTCLTLDGIAAYNLTESTQCQRLDAMQIANPDIKEGDFADAVDVWSWVQPNTEICFEALGGSVKFIDTAAMPRTTREPEAYSKDGMTCAKIDGPGILVLMPGGRPALAAADSATKAAKAAPAVPAAQGLANCMVRTQFNLNLRAAPDGEIIGEVPYNATLTALERTAAWFKVDYHGERGWISAEFVDKKGTCG